MKRIAALLLSLLIILSTASLFSGCSDEQLHIYTRGEWISRVADIFGLTSAYSNEPYFDDVRSDNEYFTAVQTCAEWEIIEQNDKFEPNKRADVNFAMVTAIKAVGLDRIANSVEGRELKTESEIIDYFNENSNIQYISGSSLYMDTAEEILNDLSYIYSNLQLKQYQDIKFNDNVLFPDSSDVVFSADGETATIRKGTYQVGDIICFEPSTSYPEGKYAKITAINDNIISYTEPSLDEIAEHITVSGTYQPEILGVVPLTEGVEVVTIDGVDAQTQSYRSEEGSGIIYLNKNVSDMSAVPMAKTFNLGEIELKISKKFKSGDGEIDIDGKIKLKKIKATVDLDVWGVIVKKAEISVTDTVEASISLSSGVSKKLYEKTFNLAKVPCKLWGIVGVDFVLAVKVGIEGSVSLVWSVDTSQSVEYRPFRAAKFHANGSNANLDVELKAKAYVKPEFKATFAVGPAAVASIGAYTGFEASAKTKIVGTSDDVGCTEISAYIPLTIFIGAESKNDTLLGKLGVKWSLPIWTSSSSPFKKNWHIEDGEIVPKCTRDNDSSSDNDDESFDDEMPIDEELIDHIAKIDDYMNISSYYVVLEEGKNDSLNVNKLPEGYSASDLVFSSDNTSVATISSDGKITAVNSGSCVVKVSTKDGEYERFCSVRVLASYDVEFTPLSFLTQNSNILKA